MKTETKITSRWQTICISGYSGSVAYYENRAAHGGCCLCQARLRKDGVIVGRLVNATGNHQEVGEPFELDADLLANWMA